MKNNFLTIKLMIITIILLPAILLSACDDDVAETVIPTPAAMMMGYAEVDVTPPLGTALGGFGAPGGVRVATGVHDNLYAQIAFFTNDVNQSFVIISIDAAGYFYDFGDWGPGVSDVMQSIADSLSGQVNIAPENILLGSSHAHSATDILGFWQEAGNGPPKDYLNTLLTDITEGAVQAFNNSVQVNLYFGHTELVGYTGRDYELLTAIDNSVDILHVKDTSDNPIVTITNYAKHPTMMGSSNTELSADFIWGYREEISEQTGAPGMFLQGFIAAVHGGSEPIDGSGWDRTYNMGKILADKVVDYLPSCTLSENYDIYNKAAEFSSKVEGSFALLAYQAFDVLKREITEYNGAYYIDFLPASWHKLGDAEFVGWPGEPEPDYSLMLKEKMISTFKFAVGLANDEVGYIVNPESVVTDTSGGIEGYEVQMGPGLPVAPAAWEATESMNWFDGNFLP